MQRVCYWRGDLHNWAVYLKQVFAQVTAALHYMSKVWYMHVIDVVLADRY
jgi:hypothetical protein